MQFSLYGAGARTAVCEVPRLAYCPCATSGVKRRGATLLFIALRDACCARKREAWGTRTRFSRHNQRRRKIASGKSVCSDTYSDGRGREMADNYPRVTGTAAAAAVVAAAAAAVALDIARGSCSQVRSKTIEPVLSL